MKLKEIIKILNAKVITCEEKIDEVEVNLVGAADMMSEVLAFTNENALLLTGLTTPQVIRTAQMVDLCAIVLVRGKQPQEETVALSEETGIPIIVTEDMLYVACGKLYEKGLPNIK